MLRLRLRRNFGAVASRVHAYHGRRLRTSRRPPRYSHAPFDRTTTGKIFVLALPIQLWPAKCKPFGDREKGRLRLRLRLRVYVCTCEGTGTRAEQRGRRSLKRIYVCMYVCISRFHSRPLLDERKGWGRARRASSVTKANLRSSIPRRANGRYAEAQ